jgi:hypothetical protein
MEEPMTPDERRDVLLTELARLRRGDVGAVGLAGARVVAASQVLAASLVPDSADDDRLRVEVGRWQADDDGTLVQVQAACCARGSMSGQR